jgi:hypothetical protein
VFGEELRFGPHLPLGIEQLAQPPIRHSQPLASCSGSCCRQLIKASGSSPLSKRKRDGRPSAPTETFVCLGYWLRHAGLRPGSARYESHDGVGESLWRLEREIPAAWLPVMALTV